MFYLDIDGSGRLLNDETVKALRIAGQIDEWIEANNSSGIAPMGVVTVAGGSLAINIGEINVWDSETRAGDEELTLEICLQSYREYLDDLASPFKEPVVSGDESDD